MFPERHIQLVGRQIFAERPQTACGAFPNRIFRLP